MANIYRYDNLTNTAGIYQDPIGGYRLSINGNVKVKGDLCFYKEGTTDSYGKIRIKFYTHDSCLLGLTSGIAVRTDNISITKKSHPESAVIGEDTKDSSPNFGAKILSFLCAPNGGIKIKMNSPSVLK
jgi:hypothetical protein